MNSLFVLMVACTLSSPLHADTKPAVNEPVPYLVTDQVALWLNDAGKLKLTLAPHPKSACIELASNRAMLYSESVNLSKGVMQTFDLSQLDPGTYQIRVVIGGKAVRKTIQIESKHKRTISLN